ncbi:MAG: alpha/beta-type small acid-soluble spore protein [Lachnospiraceae bacterium]
MASNRNSGMAVPEAKAAMDRFKTEVASEIGINLKEGYNGDLTSREAGSIGGEMVKRMVKNYEQNLK